MRDPLIASMFSDRPTLAWSIVGVGVTCLLLAGIIMTRSRWGQARPLTKCVVLSLFAHVLLLVVACMTNLFQPAALEPPGTDVVSVQLADVGQTSPDQRHESPPWEKAPVPETPTPDAAILQRRDVAAELASRPDPVVSQQPELSVPDRLLDEADDIEDSLRAAELPSDTVVSSEMAAARLSSPEPLSEPASEVVSRSDSTDSPLPGEVADDAKPHVQQLDATPTSEQQAEAFVASQVVDLSSSSPRKQALPASVVAHRLKPLQASWSDPNGDRTAQPQPDRHSAPRRLDGAAVPSIYRARFAEDRLQEAIRRGGSPDTEAAVRAALHWLAVHQSADGRWDASILEGGTESNEGGQNRGGAGRQADTGITGLALLAFLGAGHTQVQGEYRDTVQRAIDFLIRAQQSSPHGSLAGSATPYAAMYCHGISTLALSEAYSLTGDHRLRSPVERAIGYTVAAQHPVLGGWRYQPSEPGDTSQLGWQLMALTSAHYAGISIPGKTWSGARSFLKTVSAGSYGGLAAYRPGELPTQPMTAEALLCRLFLRTPAHDPAVREAVGFILRDTPGAGRDNLYYWYYGTLALYQLQDQNWEIWNAALKRQLLGLQRTSGDLAGSWDTSTVWGRAGGRAYTTALGALCLEVYYRYAPIVSTGQNPQAQRPRSSHASGRWQR